MNPEIKARTIKSLTWMIEHFKWEQQMQYEDLRDNCGPPSSIQIAEYSPDLMEAIRLLDDLNA